MTGSLLWFTLLKIVVVTILLFAIVAYAAWLERKLLARIQSRGDATRVDSYSPLQPLADIIKLLTKEDLIPSGAFRLGYLMAPALAVIAAFLTFAVIPFAPVVMGEGVELFQITDLDIGVLFVLAVASMGVYGIVLAGWSSNNKYSLLGSLRGSAQMISYSLVIGLALVGVLLMSGSLSLRSIVESQAGTWWGFLPRWNVFPQCVAFLCFLLAVLAQTSHPPFDLPAVETVPTADYRTEYSGTKFAIFLLADYANTVAVSCLATVLFLGGWQGPLFGPDWLRLFLPLLWFSVKALCFLFLYVWIRATLPRFRYDHLISFAWKALVPLALSNVIGTSLYIAVKYR